MQQWDAYVARIWEINFMIRIYELNDKRIQKVKCVGLASTLDVAHRGIDIIRLHSNENEKPSRNRKNEKCR